MIKVPGTTAGLVAIEEQTRLGINVNVTLLFSVGRYEQVADAYIRGLAERTNDGGLVDTINSVASFFLSRIDTKVDPRLPVGSLLRGQAAVASARVAYQRYLRKFDGPEWRQLAGARRQRLLWASTGTKNPHYSDVRYVSKLVGPDVVNTVPESTLRAFADHGRAEVTLAASLDAADGSLARLADGTLARLVAAGVDLEATEAELEREGIQSFCGAYDELLRCIESKVHAITSTPVSRGPAP